EACAVKRPHVDSMKLVRVSQVLALEACGEVRRMEMSAFEEPLACPYAPCPEGLHEESLLDEAGIFGPLPGLGWEQRAGEAHGNPWQLPGGCLRPWGSSIGTGFGSFGRLSRDPLRSLGSIGSRLYRGRFVEPRQLQVSQVRRIDGINRSDDDVIEGDDIFERLGADGAGDQ